jgi:tyrosine-protein phosphatase SIW14
MPRWLQILFGVLLTAFLIGAPLYHYSARQKQVRNFRVVQEGVLYRSGQLSLDGLRRVIHDYHIKTVISLREAPVPGQPPPDLAEEEYCRLQELNYHRIPPRRWWAADGSVPGEAGVRKFLAIVQDPANHPVLIHCFAGCHRTGVHCAVYRMEVERWTNAAALAEVKALGYVNLDDEWDVLGYLEQYRPRWREGPVEEAEPPPAGRGPLPGLP